MSSNRLLSVLFLIANLFAFTNTQFADSAQCSYFNETFSGSSGDTWTPANGTWSVQNGVLNVSQIPSGKMASYQTTFYPFDYFAIDADIETVSLSQGGAYGLYPYTSGSKYFEANGKTLTGIGVIIFDSGNAYLTGWDVVGNKWYNFAKYITTAPVTSIGVAYSSDAVTLRINKQDTTSKISGNFTDSWHLVDELWLMAQGTDAHIRFDNVCADPLVVTPTPVPQPQTMPMPTSQEVFVYPAVETPLSNTTPSLAMPIGVGAVANKGNTYSLKVDTGQFAGPVDLYLAYLYPAKDNILYLIDSQDKPTQAIVPWRTAVTSATGNLFGDVDVSAWPRDTYYVALLAIPSGGDLSSYYFWITAFDIATAPQPQTMLLPTSQEVFFYQAVENPLKDTTPSLAKPIGVGAVANKGNTYSLKVDTGQFAGPVDLYLFYYYPAKEDKVYLIDSNNNPTQAIVPWRAAVTSAAGNLFGDVDISAWPGGTYYVGLLAKQSHGDFSSYYFWITAFEVGGGTISLDPSNTDTKVSGTYQISGGKSISFSSKSLGTEKAEASYKVSGGTDSVDITIDSKTTGTIVVNGASMTGYGALTNANSTALSKIALGDLGQSLAMIPLEIGCKNDNIDPAVLAALVMPLQMFIKYQTPDTSNFMKQYLAKTSCKYFNEAGVNSDNRPAPQSLIVSEDYFPNVFYYFPFDEIGSASSSAAASASMRRILHINGLFDIPVYGNDKISERIQRTAFDPLYPTAEGQKFGSCGSRCRGACGVNCPSTCNITYTWECILDDKGRNTGDSTAFTTYECGAHDGCEHHDACYDSCLKKHGCGTWSSSNCMHNFYNGCDREAGEIYGYGNCASEALGQPPYDKILTFKYAGEIVVDDVKCYPYYYDVYATAGIGGFISPSSANVYKGETTSFKVTPDTGYSIASVSGCGGTLTGTVYTTGPITAICTVSATFKLVSVTTYTVTASAGAGGTISPSSATVNSGETTSFTVTPNTGYSIASVTGCGGTLAGNTYTTGKITAACTVSATFELATTSYTVTATAGTGGTISPSSITVKSGKTASFTVIGIKTSTGGYMIDLGTGCNGKFTSNWYNIGSGYLVTAPSTYTTGPITADCTVTVTFSPYTTSVCPPGGSSLDCY